MSDDLADKKVVLKSMAVNPFNGWSDWYGTDGEAVVTIQHMKYVLWSQWQRDCISFVHGEECDHGNDVDGINERINCDEKERVVEPENFYPEKIPEPGVYRDSTNYDDDEKVDESYSIYVPYPFLVPELCREWIQKLNEKYNRNFQMKITEEQKQAANSDNAEEGEDQ